MSQILSALPWSLTDIPTWFQLLARPLCWFHPGHGYSGRLSPPRFLSAVTAALGSPVKLWLVPVLLLAIPEVSSSNSTVQHLSTCLQVLLRPFLPGQMLGNPFWDWPNNLQYTTIFMLGTATPLNRVHQLP